MLEDDAQTIAGLRAHVAVLQDAHDAVLRIHTSRFVNVNDTAERACRECLSLWPCPTVDALGGGI
jgi:hypothetical protein